jgi:nitrogen fixation protein FixH
MRESTTAILARNETWSGTVATEPYEAGWASELLIFVRALHAGAAAGAKARVQISPDGIRWADEGTTVQVPERQDEVQFTRLRHFGNWVRLVATLPDNAKVRVMVTLHAKA